MCRWHHTLRLVSVLSIAGHEAERAAPWTVNSNHSVQNGARGGTGSIDAASSGIESTVLFELTEATISFLESLPLFLTWIPGSIYALESGKFRSEIIIASVEGIRQRISD